MKRIPIDKRTGHKLRRLTLDQVRAAEAVFDAMAEERRAESKEHDAADDEARLIPPHVKGPARLHEPFASLSL